MRKRGIYSLLVAALFAPCTLAQGVPAEGLNGQRLSPPPLLLSHSKSMPQGRTLPPIQRLSSPQDQRSVIDTAIVYDTHDTTRHLYAYDASGRMTSDLAQKLTGDVWLDSLRETRTYDAQGHLTSFLSELWSDGQWTGVARYSTTYNSGGKQTSNLFEGCSGGQWIGHFRETWTYDATGNLASYAQERGTSGQWINDCRLSYTYDAQKDTVLRLTEQWSNGQWVAAGHDTYTCDASGNATSRLEELPSDGQWINWGRETATYDTQESLTSHAGEWWDNSQWLKTFSYNYAYDASGSMTSLLSKHWFGAQQSGDSDRVTFSYDGQQNLTSQWSGYWSNGVWVNGHRHTFTYDLRNQRTSQLIEYWNGQWVNAFRDTVLSDANGNTASIWNYSWLNSGWTPVDDLMSLTDAVGNRYGYSGYKLTLTSHAIVSEVAPHKGSVPLVYVLSQNYPNPFNPSTTIRYALPKTSQVSLAVYDMLGRQVAVLVNDRKEAGVHEAKFDASTLASGVYIYRMQAGGFVQSRELLLLK